MGPAAGPATLARDASRGRSAHRSRGRSRGLFPTVRGEILEVRDATLTLDVGRRDGARPGLEVELYREGREIKHPKTGAGAGEGGGAPRAGPDHRRPGGAFSLATVVKAGEVKPGDRFRVSSGKINLVLLPLLGGVRESLVEAATQELVERLAASGRFRVTMGDPINVYLAQEGIKAEEFLQGKGVKQAVQRFQVDNLLAVHFKRVQNKPYMEIRVFLAAGAGSRHQHRVLRAVDHQAGGFGWPLLRRRPGEPAPGQAPVAAGAAPGG